MSIGKSGYGQVRPKSFGRYRRYRQAVLSNTDVSDSDSVRRMLVKLGIHSYFEHVFATASELDPSKPGKPDPAVFKSVLGTLGVPADEDIMVGHRHPWSEPQRYTCAMASESGCMVRKNFSSPIVIPPWIAPVWDVSNVPEALAIMGGEIKSVANVTTKGFSHVTVDVSDLGRSLRFYVETLGMKLVHQGRRDAYLEWGTAWICLQERPELMSQQSQLGVDHVALYVTPTEFHSMVEVLRAANSPIVRGPVERGGGWTVYFLDPDGTQLEFHTGTLAERMKVWQ